MPPVSGESSHNPNQAAEAIKMALENMSRSIDGIQSLPPEDQVEAVEDIAMQMLDEDEEAKANAVAIEEARREGDSTKEADLIGQQKEKFNTYRRDIAFMSGVHLEDEDQQKEQYRTTLFERLDKIGADHTDEELMEGLGFITTDEEGNKRFDFPDDIFPPYVREQWEQYATYVENHVRAASKHKAGISGAEDVVRWDYVRRIAHNKIAESVSDFLQLEEWDVPKSRQFVTKMLEQRIPTVETSESQLTSQAVMRSFKELKAISDYKH